MQIAADGSTSPVSLGISAGNYVLSTAACERVESLATRSNKQLAYTSTTIYRYTHLQSPSARRETPTLNTVRYKACADQSLAIRLSAPLPLLNISRQTQTHIHPHLELS